MRFGMIAIAAFASASQAFAGGYVEPVEVAPVVVPAAGPDWTGFYIGGQADMVADGVLENNGFEYFDLDGTLLGVFAGYRHDLGDFVIGGEIDYVMGEIDPTLLAVQNGLAPVNFDMSVLRIGAEAGFDAGRALIYGTAGFARVDISGIFDDLSSNGYFFGAGVDFRVTDQIVVGAEILQHRFEDFDYVAPLQLDLTTVGLGVAFQF